MNKILVPSIITYHQRMMRLTLTRKETTCDYLKKYNQGCMIDEVDEIVIIIISDLKDMTFSHYMARPKSMLCRKLVRNFTAEAFGVFGFNWLPNCFSSTNISFFTKKMNTINDILYYLNKLEFTDNRNDTDFENLRCLKRILVNEVEDYNITKLFDVLNIVDNLVIALMTGELQDTLNKTAVLRENILYLISFKHFVKSNFESD